MDQNITINGLGLVNDYRKLFLEPWLPVNDYRKLFLEPGLPVNDLRKLLVRLIVLNFGCQLCCGSGPFLTGSCFIFQVFLSVNCFKSAAKNAQLLFFLFF